MIAAKDCCSFDVLCPHLAELVLLAACFCLLLDMGAVASNCCTLLPVAIAFPAYYCLLETTVAKVELAAIPCSYSCIQ